MTFLTTTLRKDYPDHFYVKEKKVENTLISLSQDFPITSLFPCRFLYVYNRASCLVGYEKLKYAKKTLKFFL